MTVRAKWNAFYLLKILNKPEKNVCSYKIITESEVATNSEVRRRQISQWLFPIDTCTNQNLCIEDRKEKKMVIVEAMSTEWFTKISCTNPDLWEISLCVKATSLTTPRNVEELLRGNVLPYPKGQLLFLRLAVLNSFNFLSISLLHPHTPSSMFGETVLYTRYH